MVLKKYKNILLKNGTIIDVVNGKTSKKDLLIKNGKIDQLGKVNSKKEYHIIDCKNKIITQSFIDIGTNFKFPGTGDQESLESGSLAALSGGYTKICMSSNSDNLIDNDQSSMILASLIANNAFWVTNSFCSMLFRNSKTRFMSSDKSSFELKILVLFLSTDFATQLRSST